MHLFDISGPFSDSSSDQDDRLSFALPSCEDLNAKASSRDPIVQNENKSLRPGKQFEQKFLVDIHNVYLYLDYHRR
jgi:hypothetical protein